MKGTTYRWIAYYPPVPEKWPVKVRTNLPQEEVFVLESYGFYLEDKVDAVGAMVLEAMLEDHHTSILDEVKVELGEDVMEEPKSCPLSAQRLRSPAVDYCPTFRTRKHYQFVHEPTLQHYKKMEESRDISCIFHNFTMVPKPGYGIVFAVETPHSIEN